ncbi:MAG: hemerythrin domain-containing protein [Thermoanaerobaculia bacterium]
MPNAITMLKADHTVLKRVLRELNAVEGNGAQQLKRRETLVQQLERELKTHAQLEEEVFYPAFKAAAEKKKSATDSFYEAAEEHHVVDMVLPSLKTANPKSNEFKAKAKVIKELIEHHIKEEEKEMFAMARSLFDEDQLNELGDLMQGRKDSIEAMWANPLLRPIKKLQSAAQKLMPTKVKTAKAAALGKSMKARLNR